ALPRPSAPPEQRELDQEGCPDEHSAQPLDELERGRHGAAGGQQIVDREHTLAGSNRVLVNREDVGSILERVLLLDRLEGQLPPFTYRDETRAKLVRQGPAENEAARLDTDDQLHLLLRVHRGQVIDHGPPGRSVSEQG